jgi:purine-binding chemotaxis protein CheW
MKDKPTPQQRPATDWSEVHRRIANFRAVIDQGFRPTPEEQKKILRARAKALAQEPSEGEGAEESLEVVEFLLAHEKYGIESAFAGEVYPLKELTPLPCTPPFVLGIINVRGQIRSVIDVKKFFDLPPKELTHLNKVILVHTAVGRPAEMELGILADVILGTRSIPLKEIQPALPTLTGIQAEYLKGVAKERLMVLDIEKMLADRKIMVHEEV